MTGCLCNHCIDGHEYFLPRKPWLIAQIIHCEQPAMLIWHKVVGISALGDPVFFFFFKEKTFHEENCICFWSVNWSEYSHKQELSSCSAPSAQTTKRAIWETELKSTAMWLHDFFCYFGSPSDQIIKSGLCQEGNPGTLGHLLITGSQIMILIMIFLFGMWQS